MLLPTNDTEERYRMKTFYFSQFKVIFFLLAISIALSIAFNIALLNIDLQDQLLLLLFLAIIIFITIKEIKKEWVHQLLAVALLLISIFSVILEKDDWVIK